MLSHFHTQNVSHAVLSDFFAQSYSEVTEMANENLTKLECDIVLIEQTLLAMIQIDPTVAQLHVDCYQYEEYATLSP
jgi:hypothetical protein